jgi:hypothetical protein
MPVTYSIFDRGYFVEFLATGSVVSDDIIACKLAMAEDPGIVPGFSELCDVTGVTSYTLAPDFLEKIAAATQRCHDTHFISRTAIVVSRPDVFELAREYERLVSRLGITVIVFNHRDTAMLWLGRAPRRAERHESARPESDEQRPARDDFSRSPSDRPGPPTRSAQRTPPTRS